MGFTALFRGGAIVLSKRKRSINEYIKNNYYDADLFFESVSSTGNYTFIGDLKTNKWYVSDSMKEVLGLESNLEDDLLNKWRSLITNESDLRDYNIELENIFKEKKTKHDLSYRIKKADNSIVWIRCRAFIKWNEDKTEPIFFTGTVTEPGNIINVCPIMNFGLESALKEELDLAKKKDRVKVITFRLSGFNEINEKRGRSFADEILREIANRLESCFYKEVKFFRLEGLRFAIIAYSQKDLNQLSSEIKEIIENVYIENNLMLTKSCMIGVLDTYDRDMSTEDIIKDIRNLMEAIKNNESSKKIFFASKILEHHRMRHDINVSLFKDIYNDFENFRIVLQPIVSTKTQNIVGAEVLLRWKHEGKTVSPVKFIPELEANGLINQVGHFVFLETVKVLKEAAKSIPNFIIHFNVSYKQLSDDRFVSFMQENIERYEVNSNQIVMELTESSYNYTPVILERFMNEMQKMNVQIALDDFGSGYSSIELLLKYPSNVIKLDKSIVERITLPNKQSQFISNKDFIFNLVDSFHNFGKSVCAEGVETEEELGFIKAADCDYIQGYYFYKPMEVEDFYKKILKNESE